MSENSWLLGVGIALLPHCYFLIEGLRKRNSRKLRDDEEQLLANAKKLFFRPDSSNPSQALFHLALYRKNVNQMWKDEAEWPMPHIHEVQIEQEREQAKKLVHQLILLAIERPDIFQKNESRAILAARAFVIGHYFGLDAAARTDCKLSALEYFRKCFELDPTNRQPFSDFGSFLYELRRYEEGISILLRSIELGDDEVYLLLGVLYYSIGNLEDARESAETFLERASYKEPHATMAKYFLQNLNADLPNLIESMYKHVM